MKDNIIIWLKNFFILILLLLLKNLNGCFGQQINIPDKNKNIKNLTDNVRDLFYASNCTYGPLSNGKLYTDYYPELLGHQYLVSKGWEKGIVFFRNDMQKELLINYDIVSDILINNKFYAEGVRCIELNINDIEGFYIDGHKFIKVTACEGSKPGDGYYELLYDGKARLLMKWEKHISKASDLNKDISYLEKTIYIMKNDILVKINNRKTLVGSLSDQGKNIENYIRHKKFYVRTAEPADFVELLKYYDTL